MTEQQDGDALHALNAGDIEIPAAAVNAQSNVPSIGSTLRTAREAKGLTLADCGHALHLPIKVLQRLEADQLDASEHFVFLRGALRGYARFLGVPESACDSVLRAVAPVEQPALVAVARTSQARWVLQRYRTAATYVILTATIAVPLVVLGLRGGLQRPTTQVVSLDQAGTAVTAVPSIKLPKPHISVQAPTPDAMPFMASMTPFVAVGLNEADPTAASAPTPVAVAPAGQHTLTLTATGDCWFEILAADGTKVDSGMLHAGDTRSWNAAGALRVTLGNASVVSVTEDGQPLSLTAFQHGNVAHFDAFGSAAATANN